MEYSNPFDDPNGQFYILMNTSGEYSLWPDYCPLPAGWNKVCEPQPQALCVSWLAGHWQALTPQTWSATGEGR
ncbi:MbtH family protein [Shimwellia blattae]|uniref:MbtH-like domain-containing protein n=1 Tax=Shimwellia blattae (strain ATCC 29907 / DSM 4481 / JCM 1650 / NBRC 105725 / CDC 9005-74) TaxID=630626 RepID=I2B7I1_SHIBC|nr:MbtH family NRPS accessory protein [Shimwellia blattae]AFJ46485.1 hypothetical protein EBL_c13830 [Shimwellia blattae DSM 4481 = NBRC 105725]GAB80065.1 hypothetical protein YbdZ [Shimwellia blattae DSM 4481 = NBRC 105725]VDY63953.1 Uncharacterized protein conserved in bacteria [Shimwellia blattae]VEC22089.1 Uncharacterized protein conserved in bacteria [Shimwellia blattae]